MIDTMNSKRDKYDVSAERSVREPHRGFRTAVLLILIAAVSVVTIFLFLNMRLWRQGKMQNGTTPVAASSSSSSSTDPSNVPSNPVSAGVPEAFAVTSGVGRIVAPDSANNERLSTEASMLVKYRERTKIMVGKQDADGNQEVVVEYNVTEKEATGPLHFYLNYSIASFVPEYATIYSPSDAEYKATYMNEDKMGEIYFVVDKPEAGTYTAYFGPGKYGSCTSSFLPQEQYEAISKPLTENQIVSRTTQ